MYSHKRRFHDDNKNVDVKHVKQNDNTQLIINYHHFMTHNTNILRNTINKYMQRDKGHLELTGSSSKSCAYQLVTIGEICLALSTIEKTRTT